MSVLIVIPYANIMSTILGFLNLIFSIFISIIVKYSAILIRMLRLVLKFWSVKLFKVYLYATYVFALLIVTTTLHTLYSKKITIKEKFLQNKQIKNIDKTQYSLHNYSISISNCVLNLIQRKVLCIKLLELDHNIFKFINSNLKCNFLDYYASLQSYFDTMNVNIGFIFTFMISIAILKRNKKNSFWVLSILLVVILVIASIITLLLKYYFARLRPLSVFGEENVNILFERLHENSFPSGHTQLAFVVCTFMCIFVKKYWYWYIVIASIAGFERIYTGNHFPLDVLAGAVQGVALSYIISTLFKKHYKV
ncbi:MAG: phosphatase PAP2 family protein [Endomicrobium sp.]|jgi:undecaprenyl-diphosphatase|nr:phosphatase PAP2 family protein [Endomicrobium sp.]